MFESTSAGGAPPPPERGVPPEIAPGVYSLARLRRRRRAIEHAYAGAAADPAVLTDGELIEEIVELEKQVARAQARQARLLAEFGRRRPPDKEPARESVSVASPFAPDEIGAALTLPRGVAAGRLAQATRLERTLPATLQAWSAGEIDAAKVRAISEATLPLPDDLAVTVQDRVLPRAPRQTVPQLRAALARAIIAADPAGADARHTAARRDRRVVLAPAPEGMATLWALLSAPAATSAYEWLTRHARGLGPDDPRSMDARRADILTDLLTGRAHVTRDDHPDNGCGPAASGSSDTDGPRGRGPTSEQPDAGARGLGDCHCSAVDRVRDPLPAHAGRTWREDAQPVGGARAPAAPGRPLVHVLVDLDTLSGAGATPGELTGYGAIPPVLAREIAGDAVWRRLVTDPTSGALLDHGRRTYRPPAALADHVSARDVYCRFPGCRRRASAADLDHTVAWEHGGATSAANLHALCPHHHRLKHDGSWRVAARPDGSLVWTSPTDREYTTRPHDHRPEPPAGQAAPPVGGRVARTADRSTDRPHVPDEDPPF